MKWTGKKKQKKYSQLQNEVNNRMWRGAKMATQILSLCDEGPCIRWREGRKLGGVSS